MPPFLHSFSFLLLCVFSPHHPSFVSSLIYLQTLKNTGLLKGHRNQVKCLLHVNGMLWSGADDSVIMVWATVC